MTTNRWIIFLSIIFAFGNTLNAEIEQITITWNAFKCQSTCIAQIEQNLKAIKEVKNLTLNPSAGTATMSWEPNAPFSYEPFRYASAAVGIHIINMYVRVKGFIRHEGDNFFLVSQGDQSNFQLIGPIFTEPGRYAPSYNLINHPLSAATKDRLLEAELNRLPVIIFGPLFLPSRYQRILITEKIEVIEKNERR